MMPTSKDAAEHVLTMVSVAVPAQARIRPMMGGYLLYVGNVLVGQINEGKLFLKLTAYGDENFSELECRPPYPGAKPALLVAGNRLADPAWLGELIQGTVAALR